MVPLGEKRKKKQNLLLGTRGPHIPATTVRRSIIRVPSSSFCLLLRSSRAATPVLCRSCCARDAREPRRVPARWAAALQWLRTNIAPSSLVITSALRRVPPRRGTGQPPNSQGATAERSGFLCSAFPREQQAAELCWGSGLKSTRESPRTQPRRESGRATPTAPLSLGSVRPGALPLSSPGACNGFWRAENRIEFVNYSFCKLILKIDCIN